MTPRSLLWLALSLLPARLISAQATVFRGPAAGPGDVWVHGAPQAPGSRPSELQGIVLLPIDATGRTDFTQFLPDQPRLRKDVPFASRLILPQGQGSLYRYRRDTGSGTVFGFFVVHSNGLAAFLAAFPGTGPTGSVDPIPSPVAISGQGDTMLVATTSAAGGDVFQVELGTAQVHNLTAGLAPLNVVPQGLILLPTWGSVLTDRGPLRFLRSNGRMVAVPLTARSGASTLGHNPGVPAPAQLTYFGQGMAKSADGSTVALIAGTDGAHAHVFTLGAAGPATCVNDAPAPIADAGYGTHAGPTLALSPDGKRAAWKTMIQTPAVNGECFSRRVPVLPTPPEQQITGDSNFTDTLNDTGVIAFFDPESVVLIVGEFNGVNGIEKADFYRARFPLGGGATQFTNLTNTSGDGTVPFDFKGDIETSDGMYQIPGGAGSIYFVPGSSGQGELRRLDAGAGNTQLIRSGVAALDFVEAAGPSFVLGIEHDQPAQRELLRLPFDLAQPATSIGLFGLTQTAFAHNGNATGRFAFAQNLTGAQRLAQVQLPGGASNQLSGPMQVGPVLGFDGGGAVLATIQDATRAYFVGWDLSGAMGMYGSGPAGSLVLPGN